MYYILHGDDDLRRGEELVRLKSRLAGGDPALAELNTSTLDGRNLSLGELRHACDSIPFFGDRRMVVVHGLLTRLASERRAADREPAPADEPAWKRGFVKDLLEYLPRLPETTRLLLVEGRLLDDSHPVLKFAAAQGKERGAFVVAYLAPQEADLPAWARRRAEERGGSLPADAADLLARLIGRDLRLLDSEIDKLLVHAGGRPVTVADVQALVSRAQEVNVFELVDCLGRRQSDRALKLLHGLIEDGEHPLYVLSMLARQVRLVLQVRALHDQGMGEGDIARRLGQPAWLARRLLAQANNFSVTQLEAAHERLVDTDRAIKTGELEATLALDLWVVALARG